MKDVMKRMQDPEEWPLIKPFVAGLDRPGEEQLFRYLLWLESRDDPAAPWLRAMLELRAGCDREGHERFLAQARSTRDQVDSMWAEVLFRGSPVVDCAAAPPPPPHYSPQFSFVCDQTWEQLHLTDRDDVRHCQQCATDAILSPPGSGGPWLGGPLCLFALRGCGQRHSPHTAFAGGNITGRVNPQAELLEHLNSPGS
jgi:transposase